MQWIYSFTVDWLHFIALSFVTGNFLSLQVAVYVAEK